MTNIGISLEDLASVLSDWQLVENVRSGGEKHVVKAITPANETAALKIAPETQARRARMERELSAMQQVNCPTLVRPLSAEILTFELNGIAFIAYAEEFIQGKALDEVAIPLPNCELVRLGQDLSLAIHALWERRIVHRDIKPNNVMQRADDGFVLLDVGIARHQDLESLTISGGRPGTQFWLSPEQIKRYRRQLDFRSDFFLVGQLLFWCATGQHPFLEQGLEEEYEARVLNGSYCSFGELRSDLPASLDDLVRRLLSPSPHQRYRSIDRVQAAIDRAKEDMGCT